MMLESVFGIWKTAWAIEIAIGMGIAGGGLLDACCKMSRLGRSEREEDLESGSGF